MVLYYRQGAILGTYSIIWCDFVSDGAVLLCSQSFWCSGEIGSKPGVLGREARSVCRNLPAHTGRSRVQVQTKHFSQTLNNEWTFIICLLLFLQRNTKGGSADVEKQWKPAGWVHHSHYEEMGQRQPSCSLISKHTMTLLPHDNGRIICHFLEHIYFCKINTI